MKRRIAVVGAGTAGAAAALFLARNGHRITLFERVAEPMPIGAGLLIQPTGQAALRQLGLLDAAVSLGARVERLMGRNARGRLVMDMRYEDWRKGSFGLGMHRGALFNLLQQELAPAGVEVRYGVNIVGIQHERAGSSLIDANDHGHGPFEVIIIADGMRSALRTASGMTASAAPYPWGAVWTICEDCLGVFDDELSQRYRLAREMAGVLPTGKLSADGAPLVSFFWSLPTSDFVSWRERGLADWKARVLDLWPELESLLSTITEMEQLRLADYCDVIMPHWNRGRVVVIGDAAHATSPQLGQGANLALIDAYVLQRCLQEGDVEAALARYSRERRAHLRYYQWASRALTPLFQSDQRVLPALRDIGMGFTGRMPWLKTQSAETLAGTKTGMLFGRLPLPGE